MPNTPYVPPAQRPARKRYSIGIDPDKNESGFAVYDRQRNLWVQHVALEPRPLLKSCMNYATTDCDIYVEAGWQNKGMNNYQLDTLPQDFQRWSQLRQWAYLFERGVSVGINFGAGHWIVSILTDLQYSVHEYTPKTAKWDRRVLALYTGIATRTNQDVRDAIRAAYLNR